MLSTFDYLYNTQKANSWNISICTLCDIVIRLIFVSFVLQLVMNWLLFVLCKIYP